jgi:hypothetical protein
MGVLMKWTSRKFLSAWGITVLASFLVSVGSIDGAVWGGCISVIWAAYFAANHADKRVG